VRELTLKLYHSFPRPALRHTSSFDLAALGVEALHMMINFGAVLTPEDLIVPRNPAASPDGPARTQFPQERVCFTLMNREELDEPGPGGRSHAEQFGPFAIGLDPIRARALGVVPVMYFYGGTHAINVSYEMLYRLRELRTLLSALARVEARAGRRGREVPPGLELDDLGLAEIDRAPLSPRIEALSPDEARAVAGLFDTERVPAWNMIEWIDIILNFFQTADSKTTSDSLAYFQQREWRIVRLFGEHAQCHAISLTDDIDRPDCYPMALRREMRARLIDLDPDFFSDVRLDRSFVMVGTAELSFFEFVDEVVVPHAAERAAARLLQLESPGGWQRVDDARSPATSVFQRVGGAGHDGVRRKAGVDLARDRQARGSRPHPDHGGGASRLGAALHRGHRTARQALPDRGRMAAGGVQATRAEAQPPLLLLQLCGRVA
jgi:hypothetical protein